MSQSIIAGPTTVNPTADYVQETITADPKKVIHLFNHGQYLLKVVTSLGGATTSTTLAAFGNNIHGGFIN